MRNGMEDDGMKAFFLVGDTQDIDPRIRYWKSTSFFHFTAASFFFIVVYNSTTIRR